MDRPAPVKKKSKKRRAVTASQFLMSKHDAHLLEGGALGVFVALIFGVFALSSVGGIIVHTNQAAAVEAAVMTDLTNQNRVDNGLQDLTVNPVLVQAAQEKADDEAAKGYFAHVSPQGIDSWYWFKQVGYNFTYAGENLAVNFTDSAAVVTAWMNSPEHRANILNSHYTQIGIATASGMYQGQPTIFVVQEFGTPAAAPAPIVAQTQPAEPTQIAEATTQASSVSPVSSVQAVKPPASSTPKVLGDTTIASARAAIPKENAPIAAASSAPAPVVSGDQQGNAASISVPITSVSALATAPTDYAAPWDFYLASPETTLRYAYYAIGFFILLTLLFATGFEFKRHHVRQMAVAGSLFVLMIGLFFVADKLIFGPATIAEVSTSQPS